MPDDQDRIDPNSEPTAEEISARDELRDEVYGEGAPKSGTIEILDNEGAVHQEPEFKPAPKPDDDDPTAGMSPAAKERYEAMEKQVKDSEISEQRMKSMEGRVEATQRLLREQKEASEKTRQDAEDAEKIKAAAPTEEEVAAAAKSEQSLEELKKEFPEIVDGIEGMFTIREKELNDKITAATANQGDGGKEVADLRQELAEIRETAELDKLTDKHKDWIEVLETDDWKQWEVVQSPEVREIVKYSKNSVELIKVFDDFKGREGSGGKTVDKTAAQIAEEKEARLAGAGTPIGTGARKTNVKSLDDLTEGEYREVAKREEFPELYK